MPAKPTTIAEYLAKVNPDQRAALEKLHKTIRSIVPKAEECINYGVPTFRINGKSLVGFGAATKHCAFFPMSGHTVTDHAKDLKDFDTSKGVIRFQPERPLPVSLVRKLVKARLADIESAGKSKKPLKLTSRSDSQKDPAVDAFLRDLDHPLKKDIETVRLIILGVNSKIHEGIKWSAPSFRTNDYFATFFLRSTDRVQLIFHRGAKVKDNSTKGAKIADPAGLIEWLAAERCIITLGAGKEIGQKRAAFERIVRQWIASV